MSCPDCISGHVHDGEPKGTVENLHGLDTYVSKPSEGKTAKGIIVIIPDAFGMPFVNNKLLADHYCEKGDFIVYLPDFMRGHSVPVWCLDMMKTMFTSGSWATTLAKPYYVVCLLYAMVPWKISTRFSVSMPLVKGFFTALRQNEGAHLPIGAAGFCWGAKHTVNLAHGLTAPDGKPLLDAGFTGHPSNLEIPAELEKMVKPVSFALAEKDIAVKAKQIAQIKEAIAKLPEAYGGEVKVYPGAGHGFCVRADILTKDAESQAREAEEQAISWFQRHFQDISH